MLLKQCLELFELLDTPHANGYALKTLFGARGVSAVEVRTIESPRGSTDFIRILIEGQAGQAAGGSAPTFGITGRLGGLGARPEMTGFVSDGDGALAALAAALKLAEMAQAGDHLKGDVVITTHICPDAPVIPHDPVPLMDSPIATNTLNALEVEHPVDALLSIDTTKGNRIINRRGIAISCTVKSGYLLRVSEDLLDIMSRVTGELPAVFPLSLQDITPYGNGVYHMNSILQPAVATDAPVVGVAITAQTAVPGCATGATNFADVEQAARFAVEVAKDFTCGRCRFYDPDEYARLLELYGSMTHFQKGR
jgi:Protein of unknown function (DUF1177).